MNLLRPTAARWFEVLVEREALAGAVEALAATGLAQLESCAEHPPLTRDREPEDFAAQRDLLERFATYRPPPAFRPLTDHRDLHADLDAATARLAAWVREVEPPVREREKLARELADVAALRGFVAAADALDFTDIDEPGTAACGLFLADPGTRLPEPDAAVLSHTFDTDRHRYVLVLAPAEALAAAGRTLAAAGARRLDWPDRLRGPQPIALEGCERRLAALHRRDAEARNAIAAACESHDVAHAAGDVLRITWLTDRLGQINRSTWLGSVTGWTRDRDGSALSAALSAIDAPAVLHFPAPPAGLTPPTVVSNPPWLRPFELFARLIGTPAATEPDPSRLLALVAPLLFGFMFGDVGQGAVLLGAGLLLRRRLPPLGLLVPGGLMAMLFGVLYGSVFGMESLIPALWLRPMDEPLTVLAVSLAAGVAVIVLGLGLHVVAALWSRTSRGLLLRDGGLLTGYVGVATLVLAPGVATGALAVLGLASYLVGQLLLDRRDPWQAVAAALGELAETALQLAVNTLSFVRVGAFALAHAGLGLAVHGLAGATDLVIVSLFVGILGNLLILALEGLVVAVQTTRLILFEFFVRFFQGLGRPFEPTTLPHG